MPGSELSFDASFSSEGVIISEQARHTCGAGDFCHRFGVGGFDRLERLVDAGGDYILQRFDIVGIDDLRIDGYGLDLGALSRTRGPVTVTA